MTGFFDNARIDIPSCKEQIELAKKYDYIGLLHMRIEGILADIARLFTKQIVAFYY